MAALGKTELLNSVINLNPICGQFRSLPDELTKAVFLHAIASAHMPLKGFHTLSVVCVPFRQILSRADMVIAIWRKLFPSNPNLDLTDITVSALKEKVFKDLEQERLSLNIFLPTILNVGGRSSPLYYMRLENHIEEVNRHQLYKKMNIPSPASLDNSFPSVFIRVQKLRSDWQTEWEKHNSPLHQLTTLDLSASTLSRLPTEIYSITSLKTLDLKSNRLTSVPADLARLTNLTSLNLVFNPIENLPSQLTQLTSLEFFEVSISGNIGVSFAPKEIVASAMKTLTTHPLAKIKYTWTGSGSKLEILD